MGCIGHGIFVILHVLGVLFGCWLLIVTVPLHLIFAAVMSSKQPTASPGGSGGGMAVLLFALVAAVVIIAIVYQANDGSSGGSGPTREPSAAEYLPPAITTPAERESATDVAPAEQVRDVEPEPVPEPTPEQNQDAIEAQQAAEREDAVEGYHEVLDRARDAIDRESWGEAESWLNVAQRHAERNYITGRIDQGELEQLRATIESNQ